MNISKVTDTSQDSGLPPAFSANLCGPAILEHIVLQADLRAGVAYVVTFSLNIRDILLGVPRVPHPLCCSSFKYQFPKRVFLGPFMSPDIISHILYLHAIILNYDT